MGEFDYLAVFISIIFGISVARILEGAIGTIYRGDSDANQLIWTSFMFLVMVLNWWVGYAWHDQQYWDFDRFLVIIFWALAHFLTAIALYPPEAHGGTRPFADRRNWFLLAFITVMLTDILQTAVRGALFAPWYYLPFAAHYALLALIAIFVKKPKFDRWVAIYSLVTMFTWALIVRRFVV